MFTFWMCVATAAVFLFIGAGIGYYTACKDND